MGQKLSLKKFGDLIDTSIAVDQRTTIEFEKEEISQIAYDSRNIVPNDGACLFFAIRGHSTDGHKFIDEVFRKNKHAIIVSENDIKENYERSIRVKNINVAMASFAVSVVAVLLYHLFPEQMNPDTVIIGGLMLLVPGLAITNSARDLLAGDYVSGTARVMEAVVTSLAIVLGTGLALILRNLF